MLRETMPLCESVARKHGLDVFYIKIDDDAALVVYSDEVGYEHRIVGEIDTSQEYSDDEWTQATENLCQRWWAGVPKH